MKLTATVAATFTAAHLIGYIPAAALNAIGLTLAAATLYGLTRLIWQLTR
jgi:hypothetical protein